MDNKENDFVKTLERGLTVIRAFDADNPELSLSDVAVRTGMNRASCRRFLLTLESIGYVGCNGRMFSLRPKILELGYAYLSSLSLPEIAMPHLEALANEVQAASSISVLAGEDIVYVARVATKRIMSVNINVGTRFPAVATSMGRAILGLLPPEELEEHLSQAKFERFTDYTITQVSALRRELEAVREQRWALLDQELEIGLRALAVPVRDSTGYPVAAINVSIPSLGQSVRQILSETLTPLQERAIAIEADLMSTGYTRL